jgi:hypothetical protein
MMQQQEITNPTLCDNSSYDKHAKAWESSGLSQSKYCELHNLKYSWLVEARSRLINSTNAQKKFIPIVAPVSAPSAAPSYADKIVLKFAKGCICELPIDLSQEQLKTIFTALGPTL